MIDMAVNGIDVSQWQGYNIDFNKVKSAGYKFVILRAGYGKYLKQKDPTFETNYKKAKAAGLDVGVYWYSYADSVNSAIEEAKVCIEAIKGKTFEYPIYFDLEEKSQFNRGKAFCDSIIKAFCSHLESNGYFAGVYCSTFWYTNYVSESVRKRYATWIAEYNTKCNYKGDYGIWQYGSKGNVNGVTGDCDVDYAYVDYPTIIKNGGFNGYKKTVNKALDTDGFKYNDKGLGVYCLKRWLIGQGYKMNDDNVFGTGTQNAVNDILTKNGYKANGIAGTNFMKKYVK